jgi:two-component system response regulator HydG
MFPQPSISMDSVVVGRSARMRAVFEFLRVIGPSDSTVLITGESGTGKEVTATLIHQQSRRRHHPFVAVSCALFSETLIESELFGHERGAFTGAIKDRPGRFEMAEGGTIFLDDIDDVPLPMQVKLLRVLQNRTIERLGGTRTVPVNVRVIAGSKRDLKQLVAEGKFREDLFYRLNVITIELPPLRKRARQDIADLAHRLLQALHQEVPRGPTEFHPQSLDALLRYSWPGNVRELRNVLERARIVAGEGETIRLEDLPPEIRMARWPVGPEGSELATLEEAERAHIRRVLGRMGGNRTRAAQVLGISRATLHAKIKKYGLADIGLEATR